MFSFTVYTPDVYALVAAVNQLNVRLTNLEQTMSEAMQKLVDQVAATTAVEASAVTLIQGIVAQLQDAAGDKATVEALAQQLADATAPLSEAVSANTH